MNPLTPSPASTAPNLLLIHGGAQPQSPWRASLEAAGMVTQVCGYGTAAIHAYQHQSIDLVLLATCHEEGVQDGIDTLEALRLLESGKHVPILFVTNQQDLEHVQAAFEAGATDFTAQEIAPELMVHRVQFLLRTAGLANDLRRNKARLTSAQRVAKIGYWEWCLGAENLWCSDELKHLVGGTPDKAVQAMEGFLKMVPSEDRLRVQSIMLEALRAETGYRVDHLMNLRDGTTIAVEQDVQVLPGENSEGLRAMGVLHDVTARWNAQNQMKRLAFFDRVTGLPNRQMLHERVTDWLHPSRSDKDMLAMVWVDLDHFVRINDTLGHDTGDIMLRSLGERMEEALAEARQHSAWISDSAEEPAVLFHLGSDEFVIVFPKLENLENLAIAIELLQGKIATAMEIGGRELTITSSAGISLFPEDARDAESLMRKSGSAMNRVKRSGRNGFEFFREEFLERATRHLAIESELRRAIEEDQFLLHYQPKVNLLDDRIEGMEALVRWQHPQLGIVSPDDFISVAEQCGLIVPLGRWVLKRALMDVAMWNAQGKADLKVSVNVSGAQLKEEGFTQVVQELLQETGVPVRQLELELTEGLLMTDADYSVRILKELNDSGVAVALDDFGTGYSSLSYLTRFPISTLKIDRSFVSNLTNHRGSAAIVSATIALAHSLRMHVVAEGVEERPELDLLRGLGCDSIQGYYFSRPLPADEFMRWVENFHQQVDEENGQNASLRAA